MPNAFQELLSLIVDGDNVEAAVVNKRLKTLLSNDLFLKELFEDAALGSTVYARGVTVEEDLITGAPAFFNPVSNRFERALAQTTVEDGALVTSASSQVWGIVAEKYNSTKADLLLTGYRELDITNALASGQTLEAGMYFLSASEAGKLTRTAPPTGIPVLQYDGNGKVYVHPSYADSFASHKHYKFSLVCEPAGTEDIAGSTVSITAEDDEVEGWLMADNAIFGGNAPAGAVFGYNIAASPMANVWPPLPMQSAYLEWFRGDADEHGATGVPLGEDGLCILDTNGIWWMSDCLADAPWTDGTPHAGPCPLPLSKYMTLWFSRMVFQTRSTAVTSLQSGSPQLTITCLNGDNEQATGDLVITLDLALLLSATATNYSGIALKTLTGNTFERGPVVASIKSNSPSIGISSDLAADGEGRYFGNIVVSFAGSVIGNEIPISLVDLYGAQEENYQGTLMVGLPPARDTKFRGTYAIPTGISATTVRTKFRTWIMGRTAGDLPDLEFAYRVLVPPSPLTTPQSLVTSDTAGTLVTGNVTVTANQYIEIESNEILAAPGSVILFEVSRPASGGDGYGGEVHFMRSRAAITQLDA